MIQTRNQFCLVQRLREKTLLMPRDGATIFGDLIGKLDTVHVACGKCGRSGRYRLSQT